jgi:hypothetical protein
VYSVSVLGTALMARKFRIAALCTSLLAACVLVVIGGAYYAARQVRPFYKQALTLEPEVLERGSRELESRATALYSDARQGGKWHALFTAEQINGWLAIQLAENQVEDSPRSIRDPRVAISPEILTLGFQTHSGGVETVISVDASVFVTDEGAVAIRLMSVRAGALPLPVMQLADEIAATCERLSLPVRWTQQDGQPVAIVELHSDPSTEERQFFIDTIEFGDGEMYVAGHTEVLAQVSAKPPNDRAPISEVEAELALDDYELRLTPNNRRSALKVARRQGNRAKRVKTQDP